MTGEKTERNKFSLLKNTFHPNVLIWLTFTPNHHYLDNKVTACRRKSSDMTNKHTFPKSYTTKKKQRTDKYNSYSLIFASITISSCYETKELSGFGPF